MATPEQKAAAKKVVDAVSALNDALKETAGVSLHVELRNIQVDELGRARGHSRYVIDVMEARETVVPEVVGMNHLGLSFKR